METLVFFCAIHFLVQFVNLLHAVANIYIR